MSTAKAINRIHHVGLDLGELDGALRRDGYAYIDEIPDGFDHAGFIERLGELMPQYDGQLIWSIKADERFDDVYHSLNSKALMPHTECYEYAEVSPRYLALWCITKASDDGGQTTLADMYAFFETLSAEQRRIATEREVRFVSTAGVQDMNLGRIASHPLLELRPGRPPVARFSYNCIDHQDDPFLLEFREAALRFFEDHQLAVDIERNSLLVWDNHRMMHGRTAYTDRNRHLRRVWIAERR